MRSFLPKHYYQRGVGALGYVLLTLSLLGVLSLVASGGTRSTGAMVRQNLIMQIYAQANLIRNQIVSCASNYPTGNNGTGFRLAYPGASTATAISGLTCPGAPAGATNLWSGTDGVFLPATLTNTMGWRYTNNATDARISLQVANNADLLAAIAAVAGRFTTSEAFLATTTVTNDTLVLRISM